MSLQGVHDEPAALEFLREIKKREFQKRKRRAAQMERDVAEALGGFRVPMSGAGAIKGDVLAYTHDRRMVMFECKITQREDEDGQVFYLFDSTIAKMLKDAAAMSTSLAVLVFRYVNDSKMWCVMTTDTYQDFGGNLKNVPVLDFVVRKGHSIRFYKRVLSHPSIPSVFLTTMTHYHIITTTFTEVLKMLEGTYVENVEVFRGEDMEVRF